MANDIITIYTDGCSLNNGDENSKGGYGIVLMYKGAIKEKYGGIKGKTNNYMEMYAVLKALQSITDRAIPVEIISDSQIVVKCFNGEWNRNSNIELWEEILEEKSKFVSVVAKWVKGHNGNKYNELADRLANKGALEYAV